MGMRSWDQLIYEAQPKQDHSCVISCSHITGKAGRVSSPSVQGNLEMAWTVSLPTEMIVILQWLPDI